MDHVLELTSHTEVIRAHGMEPASRLIGVRRAPAQADVARMLALAAGDEVVEIERVRLADDEPLATELLYLEAKRFDGIAAVLGESQSLYELLRARYGVELAWADETIEAVVVPEREAGLLGIARGVPVLLLCRQSFDPLGRPIEFVRAHYRADRFRFRTRLQPPGNAPAAPLPPEMRLRLATPADAPGLARVFVSAWRSGYVGIVEQSVLDALDQEDIVDWLGTLTSSNGPTTWLVESADGDLLAFSRYGEDPDDGRRGHVYSLYVTPSATGRGIAKALLDHDLRLLAERGLGTVTLWVFEHNQVARNLYASFGFLPDGARRVEPEYGAPEIRMRRTAPQDRRDSDEMSEHQMTGELPAELVFDVRVHDQFTQSSAVERLRRYLGSLVADRFPPSVSLAVVSPDGVSLAAYGGYACLVGELVPTTTETRYDLASLTKVVCTVTLTLLALQGDTLHLDDPVVRWLPAYPQERTTLRHLLTHTAGLVDHRPFYATLRGRQQIEPAVYEEARTAVPGTAVLYSDLGYMLLGWALEACLGQNLDDAFASLVAVPLGLGPLGSGTTRFCPPPSERRMTAATELNGDQRERPGLVWGEVHDGNAYALGGVAGHAGLFAPLADLAHFVQMLLDPGRGDVLSARSVSLMSTPQTPDGVDVRGIGWRLEPKEWGDWPQGTIWHTGFTGTSILVAPARRTGVVLLTNSVHPCRRLQDQAIVRADVHRLLAEALG